jgi:hypothetical protein
MKKLLGQHPSVSSFIPTRASVALVDPIADAQLLELINIQDSQTAESRELPQLERLQRFCRDYAERKRREETAKAEQLAREHFLNFSASVQPHVTKLSTTTTTSATSTTTPSLSSVGLEEQAREKKSEQDGQSVSFIPPVELISALLEQPALIFDDFIIMYVPFLSVYF